MTPSSSIEEDPQTQRPLAVRAFEAAAWLIAAAAVLAFDVHDLRLGWEVVGGAIGLVFGPVAWLLPVARSGTRASSDHVVDWYRDQRTRRSELWMAAWAAFLVALPLFIDAQVWPARRLGSGSSTRRAPRGSLSMRGPIRPSSWS